MATLDLFMPDAIGKSSFTPIQMSALREPEDNSAVCCCSVKESN